MATQIIRCPLTLLDDLLASHPSDASPGDAPRVSFDLLAAGNPSTYRHVMVLLHDSSFAWDHWPSQGERVFTLLLTPEAELHPSLQPRLLPDDFVIRAIDALAQYAGSYLAGHTWMELAELLTEAKAAPNVLPLIWTPRPPRFRFERRLCQDARQLEHRWSSTLDQLSQEIDAYGETVLRSGLGPVIDSLSTQAEVADVPLVKPGDTPHRWKPLYDGPDCHVRLERTIQRAELAHNVIWWTATDMIPYSYAPRWDLSVFHVREIYRGGFAGPALDYDVPVWRRHDRNCEFPCFVPAVSIDAAMRRFVSAFDRELLAGINPIIRAALAHFHLMRIQPFSRYDRDVADMTFYVLLREAGLPPMPVMLVLYRRYWTHANILLSSPSHDHRDELVEAFIVAVTEAVKIGRMMTDRLIRERGILLDSLSAAGFAADAADTAVGELLSGVLIPRSDSPGTPKLNHQCTERQARHLLETGLIELVEANGRSWWSSRAVREVVKGVGRA